MNDKDNIGRISDIRVGNNRLWMRLLEIALMHAPTETKTVLREINANDRKIASLLERLAK